MKNFIRTINANKGTIIRRTVIIGAGVVAVTLAAGLIKIAPSDKAVEVLEDITDAAKKAAE